MGWEDGVRRGGIQQAQPTLPLPTPAQASDAGFFMKGALAEGIGGPGYQWLGSDAVSSPATWLTDGVLSDLHERDEVMRGYVGLTPGRDRQTAAHTAYTARILARAPTLADPSTGACDAEADDDESFPTHIWMQALAELGLDGGPSDLVKCGFSLRRRRDP